MLSKVMVALWKQNKTYTRYPTCSGNRIKPSWLSNRKNEGKKVFMVLPTRNPTKPNTKHREKKMSHQAFPLICTEADERDGKVIQQGIQHSLLLSKPAFLLTGAPEHSGLTTLHKVSTGGKENQSQQLWKKCLKQAGTLLLISSKNRIG